jgi:hypothetical protein
MAKTVDFFTWLCDAHGALGSPGRKLGSPFGPTISEKVARGDFKNHLVKPAPLPAITQVRRAC